MANGRIHHADTAEERLAAVAVTVLIRFMGEKKPFAPDYADFRDEIREAFAHQLQREALRARMEELRAAKGVPAAYRDRRIAELMREYAAVPVP